jgi:hypothetical protein
MKAHIFANLITELRTRAPRYPARTTLFYPGCTFLEEGFAAHTRRAEISAMSAATNGTLKSIFCS